MTDEHKKALAEGRTQGNAIRRYLEALDTEASKRKRGRQRTPESIQKRLVDIDGQIGTANALQRVQLYQERLSLQDELARMGNAEPVDLTAMEADFAKFAKPYSERRGITFAAWRQAGVPADVLRTAGVPR